MISSEYDLDAFLGSETESSAHDSELSFEDTLPTKRQRLIPNRSLTSEPDKELPLLYAIPDVVYIKPHYKEICFRTDMTDDQLQQIRDPYLLFMAVFEDALR